MLAHRSISDRIVLGQLLIINCFQASISILILGIPFQIFTHSRAKPLHSSVARQDKEYFQSWEVFLFLLLVNSIIVFHTVHYLFCHVGNCFSNLLNSPESFLSHA